MDKLVDIDLNKLKKLNNSQLNILANNIRNFLISSVSKTGGHIGANLSTVEISIALHRVFDSPKDKLIFDTGHQCYTHKILTGRKKKFKYLNKFNKGFSRFNDRSESKHDIIDASHAGTALSIASGFAKSVKSQNQKNKIIAIVGDGALVEGMSFEALNFLGNSKLPIIIVLNDNGYAIAENVGAVKYFTSNKNWKKLSKNFFTSLGFKYTQINEGHNVTKLVKALNSIKKSQTPHLLHVKTIKGKGLEISKNHIYKMHFSTPFNPITGEGASPTLRGKSYAKEMSKVLYKKLTKDNNFFVITPATPYANELQNCLKDFPNNVIDVGMAEQHSFGFAAGMQLNKSNVVLCIQSTFMQRAFDQIFHDIAFMKLPITVVCSRSGFGGYDSATHHSLLDISYLRAIPNLEIYYPLDTDDAKRILSKRIRKKNEKPMFILHPYEPVINEKIEKRNNFDYTYLIKNKSKNLILTLGNYKERAINIEKKLNLKKSVCNLVILKKIKPISKNFIREISKYEKIVTIEENYLNGGFGSLILEEFNKIEKLTKIKRFGIKDEFIMPGNSEETSFLAEIHPNQIMPKISSFFNECKK